MTNMKNIKMTSMKKRLIALTLAVLITVSMSYTVVQACAAVSGCTSATVSSLTGKTGTTDWTHEYKGGVLNLFTYTCTVTNTWREHVMKCGNGHVAYYFNETTSVYHHHCR